MPKPFLDKLASRLNKLDEKSLQTQFLNLARERGLLETVFQSIQEGVVVVSADGRLFYANHAAERIFGFDFQKVRGKPVARHIIGIDWENLAKREENEWAKLSASELEIFNPGRRIISICAAPLEEELEDGTPGVVAILRDITGERENETALLESERMNAVRLLAASLAHEIGNPLNALGIHLQLVERDLGALPESDVRERAMQDVAVARDELSRLNLYISKFLHALRPGAPVTVKSDLLSLVQDCVRVVQADIAERGIHIDILNDSALTKVNVDPEQMKQVFFNIVKNAIQAMRDGGRLEIRLSTDDREAEISFTDDGAGIASSDFARLFEPFHTGKPGGNGLGLSIVQRIVQDHGGRIEVASRPGAGARFKVVLPLADRKARMLQVPNH